jgi:hypothetical protein
MTSDVRNWILNPNNNFGWLLKGDETALKTAKRFDSRESANLPPSLSVTYTGPTGRDAWLATYFPTQPTGFWLDDDGDNDGDGVVNLLEYAYGFSPLSNNSTSDGLAAGVVVGVAGADHNITFRRDPRATDLTYDLQASTDLVSWTTIVTSVAGATPTGSGFVSESTVVSEAPIQLVSAKQVLPAGNDTRNFVRLQVTRQP